MIARWMEDIRDGWREGARRASVESDRVCCLCGLLESVAFFANVIFALFVIFVILPAFFG